MDDPRIKVGAEAIDDLLVMLGVNPTEYHEIDHRTTAEILAGSVIHSIDRLTKPTQIEDEAS